VFCRGSESCRSSLSVNIPLLWLEIKQKQVRKVVSLENALEELLAGKEITNPIGCNVKWDGKDDHWMPPEADV
jgi:hypothetical protein